MSRPPRFSLDQLLVQLQPWTGPRLDKEGLVPPAEESRTLSFGYVGDMQVAFVFQTPETSQPVPVRVDELAALKLLPSRALSIAAANIRRLGGEPTIAPLSGGVRSMRCSRGECSATYLFDRVFWRSQLAKHPQGLLAAVPRTGAILFTPAGHAGPETELARLAIRAASAGSVLSHWVYRFDAEGWHPHAELSSYLPPVHSAPPPKPWWRAAHRW